MAPHVPKIMSDGMTPFMGMNALTTSVLDTKVGKATRRCCSSTALNTHATADRQVGGQGPGGVVTIAAEGGG